MLTSSSSSDISDKSGHLLWQSDSEDAQSSMLFAEPLHTAVVPGTNRVLEHVAWQPAEMYLASQCSIIVDSWRPVTLCSVDYTHEHGMASFTRSRVTDKAAICSRMDAPRSRLRPRSFDVNGNWRYIDTAHILLVGVGLAHARCAPLTLAPIKCPAAPIKCRAVNIMDDCVIPLAVTSVILAA